MIPKLQNEPSVSMKIQDRAALSSVGPQAAAAPSELTAIRNRLREAEVCTSAVFVFRLIDLFSCGWAGWDTNLRNSDAMTNYTSAAGSRLLFPDLDRGRDRSGAMSP
jgi:hypothetical protein